MKSTMHPIHSLIDKKYLHRAKYIQSLTASINSRLAAKLHRHCWLVSLDNDTLCIVTDSPERAATIRYQQYELIKQINEEFSASLSSPIKKLKIKIDYDLLKISPDKSSSNTQDSAIKLTAKTHCQEMLFILDN